MHRNWVTTFEEDLNSFNSDLLYYPERCLEFHYNYLQQSINLESSKKQEIQDNNVSNNGPNGNSTSTTIEDGNTSFTCSEDENLVANNSQSCLVLQSTNDNSENDLKKHVILVQQNLNNVGSTVWDAEIILANFIHSLFLNTVTITKLTDVDEDLNKVSEDCKSIHALPFINDTSTNKTGKNNVINGNTSNIENHEYYDDLIVNMNVLELGAGSGIAAILCLLWGIKNITIQELPDILPHTLGCLRMNNVKPWRICPAYWGPDCIELATRGHAFTSMRCNDKFDEFNSVKKTSFPIRCTIQDENIVVEEKFISKRSNDNENDEVEDILDTNKASTSDSFTFLSAEQSTSHQMHTIVSNSKEVELKEKILVRGNDKNSMILYDLIIMADVLYHTNDFLALVTTILSCISTNGLVVICYEQRRKDLSIFFELISSHFKHDDEYSFDVFSKPLCSVDDDNYSDSKNVSKTTFKIHCLYYLVE